MPSLSSWRSDARTWALWSRLAVDPAPSLDALRGKWRHLVGRVPALSKSIPKGSVYVGRDSRFGRTRFGNWAATVRKSTSRRAEEHERCVLLFAQQMAQPGRSSLRRQIARELRGRRLLCHCQAGLACRAEILAALANEPRATEAALHALCEQCAVETDGDRH